MPSGHPELTAPILLISNNSVLHEYTVLLSKISLFQAIQFSQIVLIQSIQFNISIDFV